MRNILVTTDFSEHARNTLLHVLRFLKDTQIPCRILLLNTYVVSHSDPDQLITLNDELKKKSMDGLEKERKEALKDFTNSNISIETHSHLGSLNNVILQLMKKNNIDLVAMGNMEREQVDTVSRSLKKQQHPLLVTYLNEA